MQAVPLNRAAVPQLRALRMEPFLRLSSIHSPAFDERAKAVTYVYPATYVASRLMLSGHGPLAVSLRDAMAKDVSISYLGDRALMAVNVDTTSGDKQALEPRHVAPGLDVALIELFIRGIADSFDRAERYVNAMGKLVFCSPELLLNATKGGLTFRVRTDTPKVDAALIDALDVAMSKTNAMVLSLRVTRVDSNNGKSETLYAPQVVSRAQPLRPLAVLALSRFLQSTQDTPAISMR